MEDDQQRQNYRSVNCTVGASSEGRALVRNDPSGRRASRTDSLEDGQLGPSDDEAEHEEERVVCGTVRRSAKERLGDGTGRASLAAAPSIDCGRQPSESSLGPTPLVRTPQAQAVQHIEESTDRLVRTLLAVGQSRGVPFEETTTLSVDEMGFQQVSGLRTYVVRM